MPTLREICKDCNEKITPVRSPGISCSSCSNFYHFSCARLENKVVDFIESQPVGWLCKTCNKPYKRSSIIPATPVRDLTKDKESGSKLPRNVSSSQTKISKAREVPKTSSQGKISVRKKPLVKPVAVSSNPSTKRNSPVPSFSSLSTDSALDTLRSDIIDKIDQIEKKSEEIQQLKAHLDEIRTRLNQVEFINSSLEEKLFDKTVEITGISIEPNSDPISLLKEISGNIGYPLNSSAIANCFIVKRETKKGTDKLVAEFFNKDTLRNLIAAGKSARRFDSSSIYINQKLTSYKKKLLYNCKQFAAINKFRFAWSCYNSIFLKKDEASAPIKINSEKDLLELEEKLSHQIQHEDLLSERSRNSLEN
jgi:hypothetical protein